MWGMVKHQPLNKGHQAIYQGQNIWSQRCPSRGGFTAHIHVHVHVYTYLSTRISRYMYTYMCTYMFNNIIYGGNLQSQQWYVYSDE